MRSWLFCCTYGCEPQCLAAESVRRLAKWQKLAGRRDVPERCRLPICRYTSTASLPGASSISTPGSSRSSTTFQQSQTALGWARGADAQLRRYGRLSGSPGTAPTMAPTRHTDTSFFYRPGMRRGWNEIITTSSTINCFQHTRVMRCLDRSLRGARSTPHEESIFPQIRRNQLHITSLLIQAP